MKNSQKSTKNTSSILARAKGPVTIPLTNDYLFRALLQKNNHVLKGLICSLLHLPPSDVTSVEITNPIELGASIDDKTFFLDIKLILNNYTIVNLEMQVINEHNWQERSLTYLCRSFDNLNSGEPYQNVKPAIQIGFLDFTLFPEHPEFFATYKFLNVKNHLLYSDKIQLSVLDLTCIHLATEEDKFYQIDYWASLFKAATWEEIKMLASKNKYIEEASETIYKLSLKEKIRLQCEAREDYYRRQKSMQLMREQQLAEIEKQSSQIEQQNSEIERQNSEIERQNSEIEKQNSKIEKQAAIIQQKESAYNDLLSWAKAHGYKA
ncbi:MAG: Rpn family recombination-promoting nuclease/putative transposase [Lachnospiraceae bacterium]|nr:Rpn family recombination-promoting nuclease/putative transposase [Lachnospiraceae bacterium]